MTQTAIDYSDIFCQAVQNIVNGTVSNLNFDISRECTIIDIIDKAYGRYKISDGSISFEAVATEGSSYKTGDRVMVTIPQGDSNKQIIILNRIIDEWSGPAGFVRPLDTITICTDNIAFNEHDERKLLANSKISTVNILTLKNQKFFGFQRIGVAAKFKSLLENLNIIKGDYGLMFTLIQYSTNKDIPKRVDQHKFSCSEMLGNPYAFNSYFEQEYAFDIDADIKQINELIVDFYQDGQFIDGNDNILDFSSFGNNYYNLFVKDLEIYLGYSQGKEIAEIVEIASDNLEYAGSGNETRDVYLQWIHKLDEYHYENITHQKYFNGENIYEIRWYQYTPSCPNIKTDEYGGKNWELLNKTKPDNAWDNYPFTFTVNVRPTYIEEKIKAVCLIKTYPLINDPTYEQIIKFTSNTLTFENTKEDSGEDTPPGEILQKNLSLHFHDNSYGNYFLYDQNGIIIDGANQGQSFSREIEVFYDGESLNKNQNWFNSIDAITWELPAPNQSTSMIYYDKTQNAGFIEPNKNLVGSFLKGNWKKYYKTNDLNDFIEDNNFETIETNLFKIPIEFNKNQETFIVSDINNSIDGKFNLKAKVLSTLNIKDKDGKNISFNNNLPVSIKLSIWVRNNNETKWTLINNIYKTIKVLKEYKDSQLSEIEGLFSIAQKHDQIRIGFGLTSEQGEEFNKLLEDNKENNISWDLYLNNETSFTVQSEFYTNTNYPSKDENKKTVLNTIFTYSILNSWSRDRNNNTIRCKVTVDGKDYLLQEELHFGPKGSNGTSDTFILEMLDGKNALTTTAGEKPEGSNYFDTLRVEAILIKGNGKRYYFTKDQIKEIEWELIHGNDKYIIIDDSADPNTEYAIKSLHLVTNKIPDDNYAILKASVKYENLGPTLEAYLPIPIKHHTCLGMSGPKEIIYNHQGKPKQSNNIYIAYINNKEVYEEWSVQQSEENPNPIALKETGDPNGGRSLAVTPLYSKKDLGGPIYDKVCVYCDYTDNVSKETIRLWSQPILVMQSNYDFAMLNEWDGTLTIDEKNGTILTTMLGAGRKNNQNQFSGVLIGDVQDGTDLNESETLTGVYGFQNGIMTYGLKENGSAFFGAYDNGRIEIDGQLGVIKTAGWTVKKSEDNYIYTLNEKNKGSLWNLTNGDFILQKNESEYFKFDDNGLHISVNDLSITGGLGGINLLKNTQPHFTTDQIIRKSTRDIGSAPSDNYNDNFTEWNSIKEDITIYDADHDWSEFTGTLYEDKSLNNIIYFRLSSDQKLKQIVHYCDKSKYILSFDLYTYNNAQIKVFNKTFLSKGNWTRHNIICSPDDKKIITVQFESLEGVSLIKGIKLEEGQIATAWTPNPNDEQYYSQYLFEKNKIEANNGISDSLDFAYTRSYFNSEKVFNKLTKGGTIKGIFKTDDKLYINANYISTGILRSENWKGTIKDEKGNEISDIDKLNKDGKYTIQPKSGMYIDLNKGVIWADQLTLNAGTSWSDGKLLLTNQSVSISNPNQGDEDDEANNNNKDEFFNSCNFAIGNANNYLAFGEKGLRLQLFNEKDYSGISFNSDGDSGLVITSNKLSIGDINGYNLTNSNGILIRYRTNNLASFQQNKIILQNQNAKISSVASSKTLSGVYLYPHWGGADSILLYDSNGNSTGNRVSLLVDHTNIGYLSPGANKINGKYPVYYNSNYQVIAGPAHNGINIDDLKIGYVTGAYGNWLIPNGSFTITNNATSTENQGSQIQLSNDGYMFFAKKNDNSKGVFIGNLTQDGEVSEYALQIGNFRVKWDGTVEMPSNFI